MCYIRLPTHLPQRVSRCARLLAADHLRVRYLLREKALAAVMHGSTSHEKVRRWVSFVRGRSCARAAHSPAESRRHACIDLPGSPPAVAPSPSSSHTLPFPRYISLLPPLAALDPLHQASASAGSVGGSTFATSPNLLLQCFLYTARSCASGALRMSEATCLRVKDSHHQSINQSTNQSINQSACAWEVGREGRRGVGMREGCRWLRCTCTTNHQ